MRRRDPGDAGAAGVPPADRPARSGSAAQLPCRGPQRGQLRRRHPAGAREHARRSGVPVPHRARSGGHRSCHPLPPERPGAGVAAVLLLVEQHPRRPAPGGGGGRKPQRSGRVGAPRTADARRREGGRARVELRRAVAAPAPHAHGDPGRERVSGVRREPPRGPGARDGAVRREPDAGRPERGRPAGRGLHPSSTSGSPDTTGFRTSTAPAFAASTFRATSAAACSVTAAS